MFEQPSATVILLHGFASSANSRKANYFNERFGNVPHVEFHAIEFNPTPADFEYMTITGMINRLRQFLLWRNFPNVQFIASSMGALVGLHYVHRFGQVDRLTLLAPALAYRGLLDEEERRLWQLKGSRKFQHYAFETACPLRYDMHVDGQDHYGNWVKPSVPIAIIHGVQDEVISIDESRDYANAYPDLVKLIEVDSDHRLSGELDLVWELVKQRLPGAEGNDH